MITTLLFIIFFSVKVIIPVNLQMHWANKRKHFGINHMFTRICKMLATGFLLTYYQQVIIM